MQLEVLFIVVLAHVLLVHGLSTVRHVAAHDFRTSQSLGSVILVRIR
jgi:hypothetical protein